MKDAFRMVCSPGATFILTREEMQQLVTEAVRTVENMGGKNAAYILDDDRGLKIVVRWKSREVWIMSKDEAAKGGMPSPLDN